MQIPNFVLCSFAGQTLICLLFCFAGQIPAKRAHMCSVNLLFVHLLGKNIFAQQNLLFAGQICYKKICWANFIENFHLFKILGEICWANDKKMLGIFHLLDKFCASKFVRGGGQQIASP